MISPMLRARRQPAASHSLQPPFVNFTMARTKQTGRGHGRGGFRLVIGGVAHFTQLFETDKRRVLLLLHQEMEKTGDLQQQLAHAQHRLAATEQRLAEAELRLAAVEQQRAVVAEAERLQLYSSKILAVVKLLVRADSIVSSPPGTAK